MYLSRAVFLPTAEALGILCVRCSWWDRERHRDREREREREREIDTHTHTHTHTHAHTHTHKHTHTHTQMEVTLSLSAELDDEFTLSFAQTLHLSSAINSHLPLKKFALFTPLLSSNGPTTDRRTENNCSNVQLQCPPSHWKKKSNRYQNYWKQKRIRRLCVMLLLVINTTWENLQNTKHIEVGRSAHRTDVCFAICRFSQFTTLSNLMLNLSFYFQFFQIYRSRPSLWDVASGASHDIGTKNAILFKSTKLWRCCECH